MKYLIVSLCLMTFGCKNNQSSSINKESISTETPADMPSRAQAGSEEKKDTIISTKTDIKPQDPTTVRLVVDFYSDGSGSDYKSIIGYEDSLGAYSARLKKMIDYQKKPWGREGETEFCLNLKELNPAQQNDFILFTRKILKSAKFVNIFENHPCKH